MDPKQLEELIGEMLEDNDVKPIPLLRFMVQSVAEGRGSDELDILEQMILGLTDEQG